MLELTIISAETKKIQLEELKAKKEFEEMIFLAERSKRVEKMVEAMFTQISKEIETSESSYVNYLIMEEDLNKIHYCNKLGEFDEAMDTVIELLKIAGYEVNDFYHYSNSWFQKSGKFGCLLINY